MRLVGKVRGIPITYNKKKKNVPLYGCVITQSENEPKSSNILSLNIQIITASLAYIINILNFNY
jgi:hypothetical protein